VQPSAGEVLAVSIRLVQLVLDASFDSAPQKLVALVLANAADEDGTHVYPGRDRLARETGLTPDRVRRHIAVLIRVGVVVEVERARPGHRREFRFDLDRLRALRTVDVGNDVPSEWGASTPGMGGVDDGRPNIPPPVASDGPARVPARRRDPLFEAVAEVCDLDWTALTTAARGSLNRAVKDLREVRASPAEVRARAARWPFDVTLTPPGLAKHWTRVARELASP
jgi:hypothetical protein